MENIHDIIAQYILNASEKDLRELAFVCKNQADTLSENRKNARRQELKNNLTKAINEIQSEGFLLIIENQDDCNYELRLLNDEGFNITLK